MEPQGPQAPQSEAVLWEELRRGGMSPTMATAEVMRRRKSTRPPGESTAASPFDASQRRYAAEESFGDLVKGMGRSALHGVTLGNADEILASGRAMLTDDDVLTSLNKERAALAEFRRRHPEGAMLASAAGSLVPAVATAAVAPALGLVRGGAAFGGAFGAGESEGVHDVAGKAAAGAVVGAGTGALMRGAGALGRVGYDVVRGVGRSEPVQSASQSLSRYLPSTVHQARNAAGGRAVRPPAPPAAGGGAGGSGGGTISVAGSFLPRSPEDRASGLMLQRLASDRQTPATVRQAIERSTKPRAIADAAGENTLALQRWTRSVPSNARQDIPAALHERQAGMQSRIVDDATELTGAARQNVPQAIQQRAELRSREAAPLYENLRQLPPADGSNFVSVLTTPAGKDAIRQAARTAQNQRRPFPPVFDDAGNVRPLSFDDVQQIKLAFDDMLGAPPSPLESGGLGKFNAGAIRDLKNDFLREAEHAFPGYAEANELFAGHSAIMNALDDGSRFFRMAPDEAAAAIQKLAGSEREAFVEGAVSSLADRIEKGMRSFDQTRRVILPTHEQKRLRLLFPDEGAFNQFIARAEEEAAMRRSLNTTVGGSQTFEKMQEGTANDDEAVAALLDASRLRFTPMLERLKNSSLVARARGLNQETANALGPMFTAGMRGDRNEALAVLQRLAEAEQRELRRRSVRAAASRPLTGATGGGTSRDP